MSQHRKWQNIGWIRTHPSTYEVIKEIGDYSTYQAAQRAAVRWEEKGHIRYLGGFREKHTGRKRNVFGSRQWRPRSLEHDVYMTYLAAYVYPEAQWTRGNFLPRNTDAIIQTEDWKAFVELETGSMTLARIEDKFERSYSTCKDRLLVVTLDEEFLKDVMTVSDAVADIAFFGVLNVENPSQIEWRTR